MPNSSQAQLAARNVAMPKTPIRQATARAVVPSPSPRTTVRPGMIRVGASPGPAASTSTIRAPSMSTTSKVPLSVGRIPRLAPSLPAQSGSTSLAAPQVPIPTTAATQPSIVSTARNVAPPARDAPIPRRSTRTDTIARAHKLKEVLSGAHTRLGEMMGRKRKPEDLLEELAQSPVKKSKLNDGQAKDREVRGVELDEWTGETLDASAAGPSTIAFTPQRKRIRAAAGVNANGKVGAERDQALGNMLKRLKAPKYGVKDRTFTDLFNARFPLHRVPTADDPNPIFIRLQLQGLYLGTKAPFESLITGNIRSPTTQSYLNGVRARLEEIRKHVGWSANEWEDAIDHGKGRLGLELHILPYIIETLYETLMYMRSQVKRDDESNATGGWEDRVLTELGKIDAAVAEGMCMENKWRGMQLVRK